MSKVETIQGDAGLLIALTQMRKASARKIMKPGVSKALTIAKRAAKANAPKDSGKLKKAIFKKVKGKTKKGGVSGFIYVGKKYDTENSKPSEYAYSIEFGTSKQAPKPFMRAAMTDNKMLILKTMLVSAKERLEIEALKAALKGKTL